MLDIFYADPAITRMPEDPGDLERAGSIDLDTHRALAPLFDNGRQAGADLRYCADSLLTPAQVRILLDIFTAHAREPETSPHRLAGFDAMLGILENASNRGMALVAFGD